MQDLICLVCRIAVSDFCGAANSAYNIRMMLAGLDDG